MIEQKMKKTSLTLTIIGIFLRTMLFSVLSIKTYLDEIPTLAFILIILIFVSCGIGIWVLFTFSNDNFKLCAGIFDLIFVSIPAGILYILVCNDLKSKNINNETETKPGR